MVAVRLGALCALGICACQSTAAADKGARDTIASRGAMHALAAGDSGVVIRAEKVFTMDAQDHVFAPQPKVSSPAATASR